MEYTITTPLLFSSILASMAPTVPTAMVQWSFACLMGSHILCMPVLYLSHLAIQCMKRQNWNKYVSESLVQAVWFILVACAILQCVGLGIQFVYFLKTKEYYPVPDLVQAVFGLFMGLQMTFVLAVVVTATMSWGCVYVRWSPDATTRWSRASPGCTCSSTSS